MITRDYLGEVEGCIFFQSILFVTVTVKKIIQSVRRLLLPPKLSSNKIAPFFVRTWSYVKCE